MIENNTFDEFVSYIYDSQIKSKIYHWKSKSFSEHKALDDYNEKIEELIDGLIESYQGCYTLINIELYANSGNNFGCMEYFDNIRIFITTNRNNIEIIKNNTYIQNQIDEIEKALNSLIYKLKYLK